MGRWFCIEMPAHLVVTSGLEVRATRRRVRAAADRRPASDIIVLGRAQLYVIQSQPPTPTTTLNGVLNELEAWLR